MCNKFINAYFSGNCTNTYTCVMKMISSGFNLFLDSSKRLQYNNRIFEAVHAGQAEALCQRENRPLMVCHKAKTGTDVREQKMGYLNGQTTEGGDRARGR